MKFSNQLAADRYQFNHKLLSRINSDAANFCMENYGYELCITESGTTVEEDRKLNRTSKTHSDRPVRANDYRTKDMPGDCKKMLKIYLIQKYGKHGAISAKTQKPNLIEDGKHGSGEHFHVQIQRGIPNE